MNRIKISAKSLVSEAKGRGIVRLVLEEDFDASTQIHPFTKYLADTGIIFYFKGDRVEKATDYEIDLTKIEVEY